ncbi:MAG: hypothetical protein QOH57_1596 [Mycobacterium sp.]|nr:hypothetical protein [Mycobacterium sp.]
MSTRGATMSSAQGERLAGRDTDRSGARGRHQPIGRLVGTECGHSVIRATRGDHRRRHQRVVHGGGMHARMAPFGVDDTADSTQRRFGCVVGGEHWRGLRQYTPGGDIDDVPVTTFDHPGSQATDQSQWRIVVELHDSFDVMPAFQRFGKRSADRPGGIIDQDINGANRFHEFIDLVEVGEVSPDRGCAPAGRGDPLGDVAQQSLPARDHDHRCPVSGELFRRDSADSGRRARQQNPLPAQIHRCARGPPRHGTHSGEPHRALEIWNHRPHRWWVNAPPCPGQP